MKIVAPNRVRRTYTQALVGRPEAVFPLLCPVREADWIPGWDRRWCCPRAASPNATACSSRRRSRRTLPVVALLIGLRVYLLFRWRMLF